MISDLIFPACRQLVAMWQVLVSDESTMTKVFQHIFEVLSFSLPYQEKSKGNKIMRIETDVPKAVSHTKWSELYKICFSWLAFNLVV